MSKTYNGFTNRETWNFHLYYGESLRRHLQDLTDQGATDDFLAREVNATIQMQKEDALYQADGFLANIISTGFENIDSQQLTKLYIEEIEKR
jgi:hypothetical protein